MDLKIFVKTDDDIRLARRLIRDVVERGRTIPSILYQYNKFVKRSYDDFVRPSMKWADIIIPRGVTNEKAIDFIVYNLQGRIIEHGIMERAGELPEWGPEA